MNNGNLFAFDKQAIVEIKLLAWINAHIQSQDGVAILKQLDGYTLFNHTTTTILSYFTAAFLAEDPLDKDIFLAEHLNKDSIDKEVIHLVWNKENADIDEPLKYLKQVKAFYVQHLLETRTSELCIKSQGDKFKNVSPSAALSDIVAEIKKHESIDSEILNVGSLYDQYTAEKDLDYEKSKNGELKVKIRIDNVDKITGGFANGDLIVIGARPSMGKTSLALSMLYGALQSKPDGVFVFFTGEVDSKKITDKLIAIHSGIKAKAIIDFEDYEANAADIADATRSFHFEIAKNRLYILEANGKDINFVGNSLQQIYSKHGRIDGGFYDYLQILKLNNKRDRHIEVGDSSKAFKTFASSYDMPFILLSQLNRTLENRDDKRPIPADLRDSGEIEQDADIIAFIYRDEVYKKDKKEPGFDEDDSDSHSTVSTAEIIIAKHRNGPIGTAYTIFNKETTRFSTKTREDDRAALVKVSGNFSRAVSAGRDTPVFDQSMAGGNLNPMNTTEAVLMVTSTLTGTGASIMTDTGTGASIMTDTGTGASAVVEPGQAGFVFQDN